MQRTTRPPQIAAQIFLPTNFLTHDFSELCFSELCWSAASQADIGVVVMSEKWEGKRHSPN